MSGAKSTAPPPGIAAKYADTCPRCDHGIQLGDRIVHSRGRYIHVECAGGGDDE